jgi:hypothetical protein
MMDSYFCSSNYNMLLSVIYGSSFFREPFTMLFMVSLMCMCIYMNIICYRLLTCAPVVCMSNTVTTPGT